MWFNTLHGISAFIRNYHWYRKLGHCHRYAWYLAGHTIN